MLNNKEPFLFFASIPPYTKLVIPIGFVNLITIVKTLIRRMFGKHKRRGKNKKTTS